MNVTTHSWLATSEGSQNLTWTNGSPTNVASGNMTTNETTLQVTSRTEPPNMPIDQNILFIVSQGMNIYKYYVLLPICLIGNILALLVLRKQAGTNSSHLYMCTIAVVDIFTLTMKATLMWLSHGKVEFGHVGCKIISFLSDGAPLVSVFVVVSMTVDRFIAVWFPFKVQEWCSIKRTRITIGFCVTLAASIVAIHFPAMTSFVDPNYGPTCAAVPGYESAYNVFLYIYMPAYCVVPNISLFILNSLLIKKLRTTMVKRTAMQLSESAEDAQRAKMRQITVMAVTVSVGFSVLTLPFGIYWISTIWIDFNVNANLIPLFGLFFSIAQLCHDLNTVVNVFFYCLTGGAFRQELKSILCAWRPKSRDTKSEKSGATGSTMAPSSSM